MSKALWTPCSNQSKVQKSYKEDPHCFWVQCVWEGDEVAESEWGIHESIWKQILQFANQMVLLQYSKDGDTRLLLNWTEELKHCRYRPTGNSEPRVSLRIKQKLAISVEDLEDHCFFKINFQRVCALFWHPIVAYWASEKQSLSAVQTASASSNPVQVLLCLSRKDNDAVAY